MGSELKEKCAVAAVVTNDSDQMASEPLYDALFAMQHRGTEGSGIVCQQPDGGIVTQVQPGIVKDVFAGDQLERLSGFAGVGHNRYSTSGSKEGNYQPFFNESIGFAFAHNGHLPETEDLVKHLRRRNIVTSRLNDSGLMSMAVDLEIQDGHELPKSVERTYQLFHGAFSCVAMHDGMIVAFRDRKGIRPLALGTLEGGGRVVVSETCALDFMGATYDREIEPGEMVIITPTTIDSRQLAEPEPRLDIFEMVYFARPDSLLYGQRVNEVRRRLGEQLAEQHEHAQVLEGLKNPLVVPIPETGVPIAEGFAESLGLPHRQAILKHRWAGRTFMHPDQKQRRQQVQRKHSPIPESIEGYDIIYIDDSIVRLTTGPALVDIAMGSGAHSASFLVASPPVRYPDFYGIDTPEQKDLPAARLTREQLRLELGARYLGFLQLSRLISATNKPAEMFNLSCFNGEYPIPIGEHQYRIEEPVSDEYLD